MSSNLPVVAEKVHSELGASVSARWMNCPGSINLSRSMPAGASSAAAEEGTAAHELAELSLRRNVDPSVFIGTTLNGFEVDEDMADFVRVYTETCRAKAKLATQSWIEHKFNLGRLNPPGLMFGTADFTAYHAEQRHLDVCDLKFGKGVVVEVKGNKQLRYYALGAALDLGERFPIDTVTITVVQPRASHVDGVVRSETISYLELVEYAAELMAAARATQEPDAPLRPGSWCRFCPASGACPAQRKQAEEIAMTEFDAMPLDVPPAPESMPQEMLLEIMAKLPILEDWAKAVRTHVLRQLERGEEVPGYKLVARKANRSWVDAEETAEWLKAQGRTDAEIFKQDLKSPAQIEKLIGKKNLPPETTTKKSSGYTMVPAHDPRQAVIVTAGEEFAAISGGEE